MTLLRRALLVVMATGTWLGVLAPPAAAHSISGVGATNYRSQLLAVTPEVVGLQLEVIEAGSRLELENRSHEEVVVLGYQGEPYLRVGPEGAFENQRSPATYLNADRQGTVPVPSKADPSAPPDWQKVSSEPVARWHDHRVHWMGGQDPPQVRRQPGQSHVVIPEWTVSMRQGDSTIEAVGDLVWVPGPSPVPWLVLAGALAVTTILLAGRSSSERVLASLVAMVVVVDIVHALGVVFAGRGPLGTRLVDLAGGSAPSVIAWGLGLAGAWMLARARSDGLFLLAFATLMIAVLGGWIDLGDLSSSQVLFSLGAFSARAVVAVSIGFGTGLFIASMLAISRLLRCPSGQAEPAGASG